MMTTRRHPRTLAEAFGPYTSNQLQPMRQQAPLTERVYIALSTVAAALMAVLLIVHLIAK
jgi:hypothetical protein